MTFLMFVYLGNNLTASNAFTIVTLFNQLQDAIRWVPYFISQINEVQVSAGRLQTFLQTDEIMTHCIKFEQMDPAVQMNDGNFYWENLEDKQRMQEEQEKQKDLENKDKKQK